MDVLNIDHVKKVLINEQNFAETEVSALSSNFTLIIE